MMNTHPASDLINSFSEIEETVRNSNSPVFLTNNGHPTMVLMTLEQYDTLSDNVEEKLNEADRATLKADIRYAGAEVFSRARNRINANKDI